ncbi:MAG: YggS family pyridoxal phosphate-dependent enzyme [Vicinamibacterales bacterium]
MFEHIPKGLAEVRARMRDAAARSGRRPEDIRLIAVSKTHTIDAVRAAADAGQHDFGENKVQEALEKIEKAADSGFRWHLIGHLQSNKAKKTPAFACVHSIDSVDLLRRVDQAASVARRSIDVLVQVDLALEPTKHGAPIDEIPSIFQAAAECRAAQTVGLMLLPPMAENSEEARLWFARLRRVRDELAAQGIPATHLRELSMGMSHDFEVAIEEGATMIRVGTAIFGQRR